VPPALEKDWEAQPVEKREMKFFPNFVLREVMAWYVALGVLGALAALAPWELGTKADPFAPAPAGIKPEWYFMFMFQTLKLIPAKIWLLDGEIVGILAFGVAGLVWTLLPFFDRDGKGRAQRWISGVAIFALAYIVAMTVYGYIAS
jgi:quinol-cytochrome oxidoreductase complex cytochrome b subunit